VDPRTPLFGYGGTLRSRSTAKILIAVSCLLLFLHGGPEVRGQEPDPPPPPPAPTEEETPPETEPAEEAPEAAAEEITGAEAVATEAEALQKEVAFAVSGFLSVSYRARKRGGRNDEDLYGYLSLDGGNPERNDLTFHVFARATYDLDGDASRSTIFTSLNDVFGDSFDAKVYEAFVELRRSLAPDALGMERIRLGRQEIHAAYTYLLDGARIDFQPIESAGNLRIGIFGGIPEFLYDGSRTSDWLVGADLEMQPWQTTRLTLRYVHTEDRNHFSNFEQVLRDDYASLTVRQSLGENADVSAEWTTIDARTRDVALRLAVNIPDVDLSLWASYRYQNDIEKEYTTTYDPYVAILGPSFSYHHLDIQISKLLGEHLAIDVGAAGRILEDGDREAPFNREFWRVWGSVSTFAWPTEEIDLSITGEYWDGDDDETASAGFEIVWRPAEDLRTTAGVYYSLYKYDLFVVDERQDATTWYLKVRWKVGDDWRLDGRYEFETGDEGDFHAVWLGLTWTF
jgi:hypothetical protein